jgi:glycosyltransferase involved in cell wall biosynthesis
MIQKMDSSSLRIGLLTCDLSHKHGWAHYSLSLIEALCRAGADLTLVTARSSPDVDGLTLHKLLPNTFPAERFTLVNGWRTLPRVRALLRDCDVIHATIEPYAPLAMGVAGDRPYFVTGHGSYVQIADDRRWPISTIYRRALLRSHLVCVSRYTAKVAQAALPGVRTTVVNNGVNLERFSVGEGLKPSLTNQSSDPIEANPLIPPPASLAGKGSGDRVNIKTVLAVGAVKPRKGTLELVTAMSEVRAQMPDVQCVIIGSLEIDRPYVERVRAAITRLGLTDCVHLLGHVPEEVVLDGYSRADVFVLPAMDDNGKFEGYGLVYLEASAAGLPVIGTTDSGAEDAIDDGLTGFLITQSQVAERLPGAILTILRDPDLAARMGAAGRLKAAGQTWDHVAARMLELYGSAHDF